MKQDRFLIIILMGILILVAFALALFIVNKSKQRYGPEGTPAGVVRNYVLAIEEGDYERAYGCLADQPHKPTFARFAAYAGWSEIDERLGVEIGKTVFTGGQAIVELIIINDSIDSYYHFNDRYAFLIQQNGAWKITHINWGGWRRDWY